MKNYKLYRSTKVTFAINGLNHFHFADQPYTMAVWMEQMRCAQAPRRTSAKLGPKKTTAWVSCTYTISGAFPSFFTAQSGFAVLWCSSKAEVLALFFFESAPAHFSYRYFYGKKYCQYYIDILSAQMSTRSFEHSKYQ